MKKINIRHVFGKIRRKIIRILLGKELFNNFVNLNQIFQNVNKINEDMKKLYDYMISTNNNVTLANENIIRTNNNMILTNENVTKVNENVDRVNDNIKKAGENVADVNENVTKVNENVDRVNDNINKVGENVADVNENVTKVNESVDRVNDNIKKVGENVADANENVVKVNENVDRVNDNINKVGENVTNANENVAKVNENVDRVNDNVNKVGENVINANEKVNNVNESVQSVRNAVRSTDDSVRSVRGSVQSVNEQVQSVKNNEQSSIKLIQKSVNDQGNKQFNALIRITPKASLTTVVISLVEHCNLNCWGCDHYAPLAEKNFLDVEEFEKDIKRLAELSECKEVGTIKLMGGEPLLHPDIMEFTRIAREYFPESRIEITTNGILLNKMKGIFWKNCHENNIIIVATKYPLEIKWDIIKDKAKSEQVLLEYYSTTETVLKTSYHIPFDLTGTRDTTINFTQCFHANNCRELYHGRLYTCTIIPHAKHFNKVFNKKLIECDADSIDIHNVNSMKEVLEHLSKPIPFCRYCDVLARTFGHQWQNSKKDIAEWTIV